MERNESGHPDDSYNKELLKKLKEMRHWPVVSNGEYDFQAGNKIYN